MKRLKAPLLLSFSIITLVFLFNYNKIFDTKLDGNGDNCVYYILGKGLNQMEGYRNISSPTEKFQSHFPPGYPALISVEMMISKSFDFIKKSNGFLFLCSILLLVYFFYKKSKIPNIILITSFGVLCLFNFHLLKYSTIIMSEIPFLFFSLLVMLLFFKTEQEDLTKKQKILYYSLLVISLAFLYYTRTSGIIMFLVLIIYNLVRKKWKKSILFICFSLLIIMPWQIRSNVYNLKSNYVGQFLSVNPYDASLGKAGVTDFVDRFKTNVKRYFSKEIVSGVLPFVEVNYNQTEDKDKSYPFYGFVIILLSILGLFFLKRELSLFLFLYISGAFTILFLWPSQWYGIRFMLPLVPLLIFLPLTAFYGVFNKLFEKLKLTNKYLPVALVLFLVLLVVKYSSPDVKKLELSAKQTYPVQFKDYYNMGTFIKNNLPKESIVACRKPDSFYLFSETLCTFYPRVNEDEKMIESFEKKNIDYVVVDRLGYSSTRKYLIPTIQKNPTRFKLIKQLGTSQTMLFQFIKNKN